MVRAEAVQGVLVITKTPLFASFLVRSGLFSLPLFGRGRGGGLDAPALSRRSRLARPFMLVICRQSLNLVTQERGRRYHTRTKVFVASDSNER
jgi:hypothetical protein